MGIPTTHAGSLPRPLELTGLYGRRAQGGTVDTEAMAAAGREATDAIVARQIEAGVTIGNNGEQQREGFFLYVQHRMSGFRRALGNGRGGRMSFAIRGWCANTKLSCGRAARRFPTWSRR